MEIAVLLFKLYKLIKTKNLYFLVLISLYSFS